MRKVLSIVLILVMIGSTVFANGAAEVKEVKAAPLNYTFGTSGIGGVFFIIGAGLSNLWNTEKTGNVVWSTETSGGSTANIIWLSDGTLELGLVSAGRIHDAKNGTGVFAKDGALNLDKVRAFVLCHGNYSQPVVKANSPAVFASDLKGKKVSVGEPGHSAQSYLAKYAGAWGFDPQKDMKWEFIDGNSQIDALLQNRTDAMWFAAGIADPVITEGFFTMDLKMLNFKEETMAAVEKQYPYHIRGVIPANTYNGQTEPVNVMGETTAMLISADVPDEVAYQLVKTLWENVENGSLGTVHAAFNEFSLNQRIETVTGLKLHPGVKKFFDEKGIKLL